MISFGNAASSHSGLIPLKTAYKKRGELLWAIASKKNFINLHSAAFVTVFARNLVHSYKCRIFSKNCSINFFINLTIPRSIANKYTLQVSITLKSGKAFKQGLKYNKFLPQMLCLQVSALIIHWHCFQVSYARAHLAKRQNLHQKGPSVKSPEYANNRVKKLVIYYNITATLCKNFRDVITRVR